MLIDANETRAMHSTAAARPARRPWLPLLSAIMELAEGKGQLLRHAERPWASVTFSGSRHSVAISFAGSEAITAGESFIAMLPDHEFTIPRHLVADAAIVSVDHAMAPEQSLTVECELLLLEDS